MYVRGEFDSEQARLISMRLNRCLNTTEKAVCKSEEEITNFFRDKLMVMLFNERRFDSNFYEEESVIEESRFLWLYVNT